MFIQGEATIHYNKLQADPKQGKSLDIGMSSISPRLNFRLGYLCLSILEFYMALFHMCCLVSASGCVNIFIVFQC